MFAFTSDVTNPAAAPAIDGSARSLLAKLFSIRKAGASATASATAARSGDVEVSVPNLAAATNYMAWRS